MIIKMHRMWVVEEQGLAWQGVCPDIDILAQFETREEAEAYAEKYKKSQEGKLWMATLHIYPKDTEICE